jgi:VanZ family protein
MARLERRPLGGGLVYSVLPIAYTVLIFVKGSAPADPSSLQVNDKVAHAVVFFGLSLCCAPLAGHWLLQRRVGVARAALACAGYSVLIGAALEGWQSRIPHRTADVWDWVADAFGASIAAAILLVLLPRYTAWRAQRLA